MNTCCDCKADFIGDKLAVQCEPCAIKAVDSHNTTTPTKEVSAMQDAKIILVVK